MTNVNISIPMETRPCRWGLILLMTMFLALQANSYAAALKYWLPDADGIRAENVQVYGTGHQTGIQARKVSWSGRQATEMWNDEALKLVVKYRLNPLRASRVLSYLHVAMQDAVTRAENARLRQTGQIASTHAAAAAMLGYFFPLELPGRLEAMGESALATLTASQSKQAQDIAAGARMGRDIAHLAILRAFDDGADEVWDARTKPAMRQGMWRGTPPLDSAQPQEALAGEWQTWILKNGGEIQPPAPPAYDSEIYLRGAKEVLDVSRSLTPKQKQIADDWHLDQGTVTPPGSWNLKAIELANKRKQTENDRIRMLAALNVAIQDASIACWHAKYTWWVQRPVTTIHEGMDKSFMPYLVTPPHPSYVSGHATASGAAAEILKRFFPKDARQIDAWAEEAAMSRLYGGIHYRFDNEAGLALGRRIGKAVLERAPEQGKKRSER